MKSTLYSIIVVFAWFSVRSQVSLTQPINAPVLGDVHPKQLYDSAGVVPKTTGTNQVWDFSGFILKPNVELSNYIATSAAPNGSSYSGTSFVESFGQTYFYMKSSTTKYEIVGIQNPNFKLNFSSNNATQFVWPVGYGYSVSDAFSGTANANNMNGNVTGNITTAAAGSGTLILPGGDTIRDVLQVKITLNAVASFIFGTVKAYLKAVDYTYFDAVNKFPLLTVSYLDASGAYTSSSAAIKVNSNPVGMEDLKQELSFHLFPNPANALLFLQFSNDGQLPCYLEISDMLGRTVLSDDLGSEPFISHNLAVGNLPNGLYFLRLKVGDTNVTQKFLKE